MQDTVELRNRVKIIPIGRTDQGKTPVKDNYEFIVGLNIN